MSSTSRSVCISAYTSVTAPQSRFAQGRTLFLPAASAPELFELFIFVLFLPWGIRAGARLSRFCCSLTRQLPFCRADGTLASGSGSRDPDCLDRLFFQLDRLFLQPSTLPSIPSAVSPVCDPKATLRSARGTARRIMESRTSSPATSSYFLTCYLLPFP